MTPSTPNTPTLADRSAESRKEAHRTDGGKLLPRDDSGRILRLASTAANLAAGERERQGRPVTADDRQDSAATVAATIYGGGDPERSAKLATAGLRFCCGCGYDGPHWNGDPRCGHCGGLRDYTPRLGDLIDADSPTLPTADGDRLRDRPNRLLVKLAGAIIDGLRQERETSLAALGDLAAQSAATRHEAAERRQDSMLDPAADPTPPEVGEALDGAGVWTADPLHVAVVDRCLSAPPTAEAWTASPPATGKTAAAVAKLRQRGEKRLALGSADSTVATLGALLREAITPTPAESLVGDRAALTALLEADPLTPRAPRRNPRRVSTSATWAAGDLLRRVREDHADRLRATCRPRPPAGGHGPTGTVAVVHPVTEKTMDPGDPRRRGKVS